MEANGTRKLNEPSSVPTLYVNRIERLLGRVPLFPCFLHSNPTSTILRFLTSTHLDRNRPSSLSVLMFQGRDPAGAVMFTRSTPGCGTSAGPSLALEAFLSLKLKGSAASPDLIRPGVLQRPARSGSVPLMKYDKCILVIYQLYLHSERKKSFSRLRAMSSV